jgi:phage shock protein C
MIAGVCGGLADYFNIDATLVRVLFLLLAVFGGTGLVIYLVMWIIVPDTSKV